jgi:DNA polymerase III subunit delta'
MFDQLTGNQHVKQCLERMLRSGRVPGALLFSGEEGIGKKLFALEIAKAFNCRSPKRFEACNQCSACVRILKFNYPESSDHESLKKIIWTDHPDVGTVQPPGRFLLVSQMREIAREANYRPFEGAARFFLIEEADKLNDASSNALLKTLEEPPHTSHLILMTSRPAVLLPTVRSRCQVIRFSPLRQQEIEQHLRQGKTPASEAVLRARSAAGSIGRALASDLSTYKEQREAMLSVLNALAISNDRAQLLRASEELNDTKHKEEYEERLDILEALIRDAWMLSLGVAEEQLVNDDLLPQLAKIGHVMDSNRVASWIAKIEELREQLAVNINRKVATDALFLSMAST